MLRLGADHLNTLLNQPESGMGYQLVDVTLEDGQIRAATAFNAELLIFDGERSSILRGTPLRSLLSVAQTVDRQVISMRVRTTPAHAVREGVSRAQGPAQDAPLGETQPDEVFKRFSAFANDNRVRQDHSLLPGTYATTEADARNVRTGRDAVERYALPNPDPASYLFTIRPLPRTPVRRGIVQPAYGHVGGGIEIIFTAGTDADTVFGPDKIPD